MEPYPLMLTPVFKERIWGGTWLAKEFGYPLLSARTGECWAISAHPHGISVVKNGSLSGESLTAVWKHFPEWFGDAPWQDFPLLVKLIDAADDLSVQVHPDDEMARLLEGESNGKTECWYVLDAEAGAQIVYGHHAQSQKELAEWVYAKKWDALLRRITVRKGDFVFIPAGTVHALGKGVRVLEVQQSSDVTYRIYDYDRLENGKPRPLHTEQALKVTKVPSAHQEIAHVPEGATAVAFDSGPYFHVVYRRMSGKEVNIDDVYDGWRQPAELQQSARVLQRDGLCFLTLSILSGSGVLYFSQAGEEMCLALNKGDHILLPGRVKEAVLSGTLEWITALVPLHYQPV